MSEYSKPTFTVKEIAAATGINDKTISSRAKRCRERGEFPAIPKRAQAKYTYEQVKAIISRPRKAQDVRPAAVDALKRMLQNDGFPIARKEAKNAKD